VERRCDTHCSCTPEEVCVNHKCVRRMVPGEYGCQYDIQCSYDCQDAFCDKEMQQCKCAKRAKAFVEIGLCYKSCPHGTIETEDGRCKVTNKSSTFWESESLQRKLRDSHICGPERFRNCSDANDSQMEIDHSSPQATLSPSFSTFSANSWHDFSFFLTRSGISFL